MSGWTDTRVEVDIAALSQPASQQVSRVEVAEYLVRWTPWNSSTQIRFRFTLKVL